MSKIIVVVASTRTLANGKPTGYTLEELAAPYVRFRREGYEVDIASPAGGPVTHDPAYESGPFLTDDGRALLADRSVRAKLANTIALGAVDASAYDAIFLVGGVPAAKDFDANPELQHLLARMLARGRPIGAVCHGVVGLTSLASEGGRLAALGHPMTGFSYDEEVAADLLDVVAVVPEKRLRAVGADYRKATELWGVCVVEGRYFITGQNPASAGPTAEALIARIAYVRNQAALSGKRNGPPVTRRQLIEELGLEKYAFELDRDGYTVVPPEVTGVSEADLNLLTSSLLSKSEELVGCRFDLETGAECELDYGNYQGSVLELQSQAKPSQFLLMQLCTFGRPFRDLAINPVAVALMRYLIDPTETRFSSHNCFLKWAGEGYGESLGLHADQCDVPLPWGRSALTANCNWVLTDYTLANGAFACVPGSHYQHCNPIMPQAVKDSIPIECPRGSLIAFHGALWHGAYPRTTPGLRLTIANYYRHACIQPQDDIPNHFPKVLAEDCRDPELFRELAGFGFPYQSQALPLPRAIRKSA